MALDKTEGKRKAVEEDSHSDDSVADDSGTDDKSSAYKSKGKETSSSSTSKNSKRPEKKLKKKSEEDSSSEEEELKNWDSEAESGDDSDNPLDGLDQTQIMSGRRTRGVQIDFKNVPKPRKDDFLSGLADSDSE
eukprot:CFRG5668T1